MHGACILETAGLREHTVKVLREMHRCTWFGFDGCNDAVATFLGLRPGDPFGGMLFLFFIAARLATLQQRLQEAGVATTVPWSGARTLAALPAVEGQECRHAAPSLRMTSL